MSEGGYGFVAARVEVLRERIAAAEALAGRAPGSAELMAVTKFHPLEAVQAAWEAGIRLFGESRVQEAAGKFPDFLAARPGARLDLIGHLQSNKAKKAVSLFSRIQSVDSLEILGELARRAAAERGGAPLEILLELHTGEESKAGFPDADALFRACEECLRLAEAGSGLVLRGLMTMAPYTKDREPIRASFRSLRAAFDGIVGRFAPAGFTVLSMGMTNDYETAVEEGSTLLRIGSALFGERTGP